MASSLSVLLISSQQNLVEQLKAVLSPMGVKAEAISSPESIQDEYKGALDICLIDPEPDPAAAFELVHRLRHLQPKLYIAGLVKPHDTAARHAALEHGADHVFHIPLEPLEIQAAVNCFQRQQASQSGRQEPQALQGHALELNNLNRSLRGSLSEQALTMSEFLLLQALARAKGKQLELWQIYDVLGKNEQTLQKPALEAQISRLRKKLKDAGAGNQALKSMRLKGYQLCCPIQIS